MKKFNLDELIWFIILIFIIFSIVFMIKSGNITNFVSSDMIIYFYASIFILGIFSVAQFPRIFTIKRRQEITNKFIPLTFTLCIGVILLYVLPVIKNLNSTENKILFYNVQDAIEITSDNYEILEELDKYNGKRIIFLGYVDYKQNDDEFIVLSREAVSCCQADKEKLQLYVKGIDKNIEVGQWISIIGKISFDNNYYISVEEYKLQNEPREIYFHQKL